MPMRVTAVVSTLNEEKTVAAVVQRCLPYATEVWVVDGGSEDGTCEAAARGGARIVQVNRRGKGLAYQAAIAQADADILVFVDADGSHRPEDIPRLLAPILREEADLVIASRVTGGSDELYGQLDHLPRVLLMKIQRYLVNGCLGSRLTEIQNGFRAIRTAVAREFRLQERGFEIEQEMAIRSLRMGYRVANVPSHEDRRLFGRSRLRLWRVAPRGAWRTMVLLLGPALPPAGPENRRASTPR
jgi:glycosyltransferase involved in cell wall biosynthesis